MDYGKKNHDPPLSKRPATGTDHCSDPVVGAILSGRRYDLSGINPAVRPEYESPLTACGYCRRRQHVHRMVDVLLISVTTLSIFAFLLAIAVMHRVEGHHPRRLRQIPPDARGHRHLSLEAVAIAGLMIIYDDPLDSGCHHDAAAGLPSVAFSASACRKSCAIASSNYAA